MEQPVRGVLGTAARAERDERIWRLRVEGWSMEDIAREVGMTKGRISQIVSKRIDEHKALFGDKLADLQLRERTLALARLDAQEREVWAVVRRRHFHVNSGAVVSMPRLNADGDMVVTESGEDVRELLEDDKPVLDAINGALDKIGKRRAALLGLDAPTRVETTGTYSYSVNGVDVEAMK